MSSHSDCPATFFVDVKYPDFPYPLRELVRYSPSLGLVFNAAFSKRYWFLALRSGVRVDRSSSPWLRCFDSVRFSSGYPGTLPVR